MLDVRKPRLRPYALEGNFGLERESLRVTAEGRMALTPHPFPPDHPRIVRDFCENQTEINTRVRVLARFPRRALSARGRAVRQVGMGDRRAHRRRTDTNTATTRKTTASCT